jgi:hypothetical protein
MIIKDLEMTKELTGKALSAVRGGSNFAFVGGQLVAGGGILSPTTALNAPSVAQSDVAPVTVVDINTANVLASMGTLIAQF